MNAFARLVPGAAVPSLRVGTVGGPCWRLCDQKPKHFVLVMFYRGLHCDACREQLKAVERRIEDFQRRGVRVLAVSADSRERAERTAVEWGIDKLTLCWGLGLDQARSWGLYVTEGRGLSASGLTEPPFFVEPAVFLVRPDGTLFASVVQTMPFARPRIDDVLAAIDHATATGCCTPPCGGAEGETARCAAE